MKTWKWLAGKKTYAVAIIGAIVIVLEVFHVHIPEIAWQILGVLGLAGLRNALPE